MMSQPWKTPVTLNTYRLKGKLFPFQHQGALFLAMVKNCLFTDATGLGKTVQAIAAYEVLKQKQPTLQMVVCTVASAQIQWLEEGFKEFLPHCKVAVVPASPAPVQKRYEIYEKFSFRQLDVMIVNYDQLRRDSTSSIESYDVFGHKKIQHKMGGPFLDCVACTDFILVLDEATKVKNISSLTSKAMQTLAAKARGVKAMTATPIFTHLVDIYGIFKIIEPRVFVNKEKFKREFCTLDYRFTPYGTISGYKNHDQLRERIQKFMFGRTKREVAEQLPEFFTKNVYVDLPPDHMEIYQKIKSRRIIDDPETPLMAQVASIMHQQVCSNNLECVKVMSGDEPYSESHPKIDAAVELVEGELSGQKIIIFSQFTETISILEKKLQKILKKSDIFRISGVESQVERHKNKKKWQDCQNTAVLLMTTAGGVALNLQAAETIIMVDRPWSTGSVDQLRGRFDRIGSKHEKILEINLVARGTIDEEIIQSLSKKRRNITKVVGKGDVPKKLEDGQ